jgi:hypothetical protein
MNPFPHGPSTPQVLLGLFIAWQLFFLWASNLLKLAEADREQWKDHPLVESLLPGWTKKEGHIHDGIDTLMRVLRRWEQITNQSQNWSLFAPWVADHIPFPAVQLCWEDEPRPASDRGHFLLSDNEPRDPYDFVRFGHFRLRRYEQNLPAYLRTGDEPRDKYADDWRAKIQRHVRNEEPLLLAYLRWKLRRYQAEHPDEPEPVQIVLWERMYRIPPPDQAPQPWTWTGPESRPLLRWRPAVTPPAGHRLLEPYNPVLDRFEYVK